MNRIELNLAALGPIPRSTFQIPSLFSPPLFAYDQFAKRSKIKKRVPISATMSLTITRSDSELFCRLSGFRAYRIYPEAATEYFFEVMNAQVEFIRDESGQVDSLTFTIYGNKIPAQRTK
jgi:hypothetical protein